MTLSTADVAYAAAVIDNLAALRSRTLGQSVLPVIQVSGKYGSLLWLGQVTGTKVVETRRRYSKHNCTEHCPTRHQDIQSISGRWSITGMRATIVLAACLPYLRVQADKARELIKAGLEISYQTQVVNDMRKLGWAIPDLPEHTHPRVKATA